MKNMQFKKEICQAKKIIVNNKKYSKGYQKYCVIPIKGTENIKELFSKMNNPFKVVLIVTGSGDQILEAVLHGAKEITCFDINILAKFGCQLKVAAVKALSYEDFICFYTRGFSIDLFKKILCYLGGDAFFFWKELFATVSHYDIHSNLFDSKIHMHNGMIDSNCSLYSPEEYYQIKENLKDVKINYVDSNLLNLSKNKEIQFKRYDIAYFSNIYYYLGRSEKFYSQFLKQKIVPLLRENGEAFIHYLYGQSGKMHLEESVMDILWYYHNQETIEQLDKYLQLSKYYVSKSGYGNPIGDKDVVLSLKK